MSTAAERAIPARHFREVPKNGGSLKAFLEDPNFYSGDLSKIPTGSETILYEDVRLLIVSEDGKHGLFEGTVGSTKHLIRDGVEILEVKDGLFSRPNKHSEDLSKCVVNNKSPDGEEIYYIGEDGEATLLIKAPRFFDFRANASLDRFLFGVGERYANDTEVSLCVVDANGDELSKYGGIRQLDTIKFNEDFSTIVWTEGRGKKRDVFRNGRKIDDGDVRLIAGGGSLLSVVTIANRGFGPSKRVELRVNGVQAENFRERRFDSFQKADGSDLWVAKVKSGKGEELIAISETSRLVFGRVMDTCTVAEISRDKIVLECDAQGIKRKLTFSIGVHGEVEFSEERISGITFNEALKNKLDSRSISSALLSRLISPDSDSFLYDDIDFRCVNPETGKIVAIGYDEEKEALIVDGKRVIEDCSEIRIRASSDSWEKMVVSTVDEEGNRELKFVKGTKVCELQYSGDEPILLRVAEDFCSFLVMSKTDDGAKYFVFLGEDGGEYDSFEIDRDVENPRVINVDFANGNVLWTERVAQQDKRLFFNNEELEKPEGRVIRVVTDSTEDEKYLVFTKDGNSQAISKDGEVIFSQERCSFGQVVADDELNLAVVEIIDEQLVTPRPRLLIVDYDKGSSEWVSIDPEDKKMEPLTFGEFLSLKYLPGQHAILADYRRGDKEYGIEIVVE